MSSPLQLNQTITLSYASQAIYVLLSPCDMLFSVQVSGGGLISS